MRVCYLINQYPKVSHSFIRREILALEGQGAEVLRVALRGWREKAVDAQDAQEKAVTRYVLKGGTAGLLVALIRQAFTGPLRLLRALRVALGMARRADRPLLLHFAYVAEACIVARWARAAGCQHIHAHFGTNSAETALLAALVADLPWSFTVHGPEEFDRPGPLHLAEKIRHASQVVGVSSFGRSQLYRYTELSQWSKVKVVHCGLDRLFTQEPEAVPPSPHTLVCVGRLCEQKGQLLLVQALRRVLDAGVDCRLVLAGDGEMRAQVEAAARELGVESKLSITGWIDGPGVRQRLLEARALVLPSFAEGLPVVIMESLALKRPVISTYVAGIPELVQSGRNGWLVPAGDVEALADAMIDCLRAPEATIAAMGEAGRARALERHDAADQAAKLLRIFRGEA